MAHGRRAAPMKPPRSARTREMGRQVPRSSIDGISWSEVCRRTRSLEANAQQPRRRLIEDIPAPTDWHKRWALQPETTRRRASTALRAGAARIQLDLHRRGVLCDAQAPCEVAVAHDEKRAPTLRICLSGNASRLRDTRVCDPWGERWQRNGGMYLDTWLGRSGQAECHSFDMESIARWWHAIRSLPPFLNATNPWLGRHVAAKFMAVPQMDASTYLSALPRLVSNADGLLPSSKPQTHGSCAFVGSGHDLRCSSAPLGAEIDAHDAVFRANGAQQPENDGRYVDPARAGRRTDYRVNCLHNSTAVPSMRDEVCVVPLAWWLQPPGGERVSNTARVCCEPLVDSKYNLATMLPLVERGYRFAFLNGAASFVASLGLWTDPKHFEPEAMMSVLFPHKPGVTIPDKGFLTNSGGNAMYAALAMCDRVDVYGVGLFSEGATGDKMYAHAYDDHVGRCATPARGLDALRMKPVAWNPRKTQINGLSYAPNWLRGRIDGELLMHVLHGFDIVRWRQ